MLANDRACTRATLPNFHGKEGVDGSSPSEGSAKAPHNAGFCFVRTCILSNVRWVWSPFWSLQIDAGAKGATKSVAWARREARKRGMGCPAMALGDPDSNDSRPAAGDAVGARRRISSMRRRRKGEGCVAIRPVIFFFPDSQDQVDRQTRRDASRHQARSRKPLDVNNARRALRSPEANHARAEVHHRKPVILPAMRWHAMGRAR